MKDYSKSDVLVWLNHLGISNKAISSLNDRLTDVRDILKIDSKYLYKIEGMTSKIINKIVANRKKDQIEAILSRLKENDIDTITIFNEDYPKSLYNVFEKPMVLYKKGDLIEEDELAIGIVGSRKATDYGKWACEKFSRDLSQMGVTIVSGLALGIDSVAHRAALDEGGRSIAILGNGLNYTYPKRNKKLYEEMPRNGAILSEFPLDMPPLAHNFPQRNRIISGLSLAIIVIEAEERSGSLITAHNALDQGKDIFALPGNINSIFSKGTNKLIKDGARPLLEIDDIIEEIYQLQERILEKKKENLDLAGLSDSEQKIVKSLKDGPLHADMISYKTGIGISTLIGSLTILEMKGIINELSSQTFTLS